MPASTAEEARSLSEARSWPDRYAVSYYLFLFLVGSIGGWCLELVFRSVCHGGLQLPGFLYGPWCPIYGTGVLLITLLCRSVGKARAFFRIVLAASVLEYVTSWFFETFFNRLLWDYSMLPLSIGTRVSLPFSLAWGFLGLAFCALLEPWLKSAYRLHAGRLTPAVGIALTLMAFDTICSMA